MAFLIGQSDAEILSGTSSPDTMYGLSGDDELLAGDGGDFVNGGDGADTIYGGAGNDALFGHSPDLMAGQVSVINAIPVADGLIGPLDVQSTAGQANSLYVAEKNSGRIVHIDTQTGVQSTFLDIPDAELDTTSANGLLSVAFHPDHANNGLFYVYMINAEGDVEIREYARSATNPDIADPDSAKTILTIPMPPVGETNHVGGTLAFGPQDGLLYISVGDGGYGNDISYTAQDVNVLLGKLLRIDVEGDDFPSDPGRNYAIPPSNPFVNQEGADEIFSFGLRNPYRMSFDPKTGDLYIGDVGAELREEINFIPAGSVGGQNFGFPILQGTETYQPPLEGMPAPDDPSLVAPLHEYPHPLDGGASVTGGQVYRGPLGGLEGAYIYADFVSGQIWTLRQIAGRGVDVIERTAQIVTSDGPLTSIVSFGTDSQGQLYVVSISGTVYRLDPIMDAGAESDTIHGEGGDDVIFGGMGDDILTGGSGRDSIWGGEGADIIDGMDDVDLLYGEGGDDDISGGSGADLLDGGAGDDTLTGGMGGDALLGGVGNDDIFGNGDDDVLLGGAGDDHLVAGLGHDTLLAGEDNDRLEGGEGNDQLFGEAGNDLLFGGLGNDFLSGGAGNDVLDGEAGNDLLDGGADTDNLNGNTGDDSVNGGGGNDGLLGGDGADALNGGAGHDYMIGGAGDDTFVIQDGTDTDLIVDFTTVAGNTDVVDITAFGFADFANVQTAMTQTAFGTHIQLDADDAIFLQGLTIAELTADDFLL